MTRTTGRSRAGDEGTGDEAPPDLSASPPLAENAPFAPDTAGAEEEAQIPNGRATLLETLLDDAGVGAHRALFRSVFSSVVDLVQDGTDTGDLKLAAAAIAEMAEAFRVFAPYRHELKATFFGSARTQPEDPLYVQARELANRLAGAGWMVVTGAGPGIMAAGMEGAGRERSLGVNIRLPHEQGANPFIAHDPKLVEMRYFFTRKLMLIKESHGYAVLPGGFGTLDEAFELLTLLQTGKAQPAPLVLLDVDGGTYWKQWQRFLRDEVEAGKLISPDDHALYMITTDVDRAAEEILGFYRNYHSCRWVGDLLVLRVRRVPNALELAELNRRFSDIVAAGVIRETKPLPPERASGDHLEFGRIALRFDRLHYGRLRQFIDALNELASPPGP